MCVCVCVAPGSGCDWTGHPPQDGNSSGAPPHTPDQQSPAIPSSEAWGGLASRYLSDHPWLPLGGRGVPPVQSWPLRSHRAARTRGSSLLPTLPAHLGPDTDIGEAWLGPTPTAPEAAAASCSSSRLLAATRGALLGTHALQTPTARWGQRCQVRTEGQCGVCRNFGPHPRDTPVPHTQYCVCKFTGTAENCPPHRQGHRSAWWLPSLSEGAQGQAPQDEHRVAWCPHHPLWEAVGQPGGLHGGGPSPGNRPAPGPTITLGMQPPCLLLCPKWPPLTGSLWALVQASLGVATASVHRGAAPRTRLRAVDRANTEPEPGDLASGSWAPPHSPQRPPHQQKGWKSVNLAQPFSSGAEVLGEPAAHTLEPTSSATAGAGPAAMGVTGPSNTAHGEPARGERMSMSLVQQADRPCPGVQA